MPDSPQITQPFDAELELTADHAQRLIRRHFPALPAATCTLIGRGWDNVAFMVDDAIVFRFPRKASAAVLMATEAQVLPQLAGRLPLALPNPRWIGQPTEEFPWPFVGYELIAGQSACALHPTRAERHAAAPVLGAFLSRLHALDIEGLPRDTLERTNFNTRLSLLRQRLAQLVQRRFIDAADPWLDLFNNAVAISGERPLVPVHGDLYACHLIFDANACLTGIIDWGDVHLGDPALDLMAVFGFLPAAARADFFAEYGNVDADTLDIARLRGAFHAITVAWYGSELANDDLLREGLTAMELALEG